jgi:hypothetical protein
MCVPSGEKKAHSACDLLPNLITLSLRVGYFSSSSACAGAAPRNKSYCDPVKKGTDGSRQDEDETEQKLMVFNEIRMKNQKKKIQQK